MLATKVVLKDKQIENERLELTDKGSIYFLGPRLTLSHCNIVLKVAAANLLFRQGTRFINCTFEIKQELKNHQDWVLASIKGCRFKGRMSGCDFGNWPGYEEGWEQGAIEDCDFTEARLDGCRFMGCDPMTIQYPRWPCYTFIDPIGRAAELRRVEWPGRYGDIVVKPLDSQPPTTKALTDYAPTVAKQCDTTPEALRAVIETFDCFRY